MFFLRKKTSHGTRPIKGAVLKMLRLAITYWCICLAGLATDPVELQYKQQLYKYKDVFVNSEHHYVSSKTTRQEIHTWLNTNRNQTHWNKSEAMLFIMCECLNGRCIHLSECSVQIKMKVAGAKRKKEIRDMNQMKRWSSREAVGIVSLASGQGTWVSKEQWLG